MPTSQHPTSNRRSPKPSHLPAKTTHITPKTRSIRPHAPIYPHVPSPNPANISRYSKYPNGNELPWKQRLGPTAFPKNNQMYQACPAS